MVLSLAGLVTLLPQAQAAFPGRNGALLVYGQTEAGQCLDRPKLVGRLADYGPDECDVTLSGGTFARFLLLPGEKRLRKLGNIGSRTCFLGVCVQTDGKPVWWTGDEELDASIDASGTRITVGDVQWSPGRSRTVTESQRRLTVRNVSDGRTVMKRRGESPDWSIKSQIAFTRDDKLYVMDGAGRHPRLVPLPYTRKIDPPNPATEIRASSPDWSPDGSWIAFDSHYSAVMAVRNDGKGLRLIAKNARHPVWSPDGSLIAFDDPQNFGGVGIVSAKKAGGPALPRPRTLISNATLLDWQALPTLSGR